MRHLLEVRRHRWVVTGEVRVVEHEVDDVLDRARELTPGGGGCGLAGRSGHRGNTSDAGRQQSQCQETGQRTRERWAKLHDPSFPVGESPKTCWPRGMLWPKPNER